jgi:hypothetical protein
VEQVREDGSKYTRAAQKRFAGTTGRKGGIKFNPKAKLDNSQVKQVSKKRKHWFE